MYRKKLNLNDKLLKYIFITDCFRCWDCSRSVNSSWNWFACSASQKRQFSPGFGHCRPYGWSKSLPRPSGPPLWTKDSSWSWSWLARLSPSCQSWTKVPRAAVDSRPIWVDSLKCQLTLTRLLLLLLPGIGNCYLEKFNY